MATGMFGANPEELRAVGGRIQGASDLVERSGFDLRAEIENVQWFGPDADVYRETWGESLHHDTSDLAGVLRGIRGDLDRQADEQEEASAAGGSEGCLQSTFGGIGDFFGNFFGAIWGDVKGLASLIGFDENWDWSWDNLADTWTGMGVLIGYNPQDGTWGNWGLAGESWKSVGKDLLAWDQWKDDPWGASGTVLWNVGSMFIPFAGIAGKGSKLGLLDNVAASADNVALHAVDDVALRAADDVAVRAADDVAVRAADGAAVRAADDVAPKAADDVARRTEAWNRADGYSPDVPEGTRVDGAGAHKMSQHNGPYDTGAVIDPETGMLTSTSGRTFAPEDVSHHYTSSTGQADSSLRVSTEADTPPFQPNHRFVLDDGKTVIETNANGMPDYTRYTMDGRAIREGGGPEDFSSKPYRSGTQTSAANWPEGTTHGAGVDNRGHASPAQHRGPNEDLNTMPQSIEANNYQADVEMAISDHYHGPNGGTPLIVERHVEFDGMHASEYRFVVTENGKPVDLGIDLTFPDDPALYAKRK